MVSTIIFSYLNRIEQVSFYYIILIQNSFLERRRIIYIIYWIIKNVRILNAIGKYFNRIRITETRFKFSTKRWNPWTLKGKEKRKREREQEKKEIGEQRDEDFHKKGKTHIWEQ